MVSQISDLSPIENLLYNVKKRVSELDSSKLKHFEISGKCFEEILNKDCGNIILSIESRMKRLILCFKLRFFYNSLIEC